MWIMTWWHKLWATRRWCQDRHFHVDHYWTVTRLGDTAWFKCPGVW